VVTPAAKRQAVLHLQTVFDVSQRRACEALALSLNLSCLRQNNAACIHLRPRPQANTDASRTKPKVSGSATAKSSDYAGQRYEVAKKALWNH
jgi:hypothetical protein